MGFWVPVTLCLFLKYRIASCIVMKSGHFFRERISRRAKVKCRLVLGEAWSICHRQMQLCPQMGEAKECSRCHRLISDLYSLAVLFEMPQDNKTSHRADDSTERYIQICRCPLCAWHVPIISACKSTYMVNFDGLHYMTFVFSRQCLCLLEIQLCSSQYGTHIEFYTHYFSHIYKYIYI